MILRCMVGGIGLIILVIHIKWFSLNVKNADVLKLRAIPIILI